MVTDDRCVSCDGSLNGCETNRIISGRHCCGACHHPDAEPEGD